MGCGHDDAVDMLLSALGMIGCVLALALFLLWRGWGGWPKNARLLCRKCEYLLEGLERPKVCPECGADLTRRRAIRVGERRKRKRVLFFGVSSLIIALMLGGVLFSIARNARINWNRAKPVWMLQREALNAAPAVIAGMGVMGSPALDELAYRARNDLLTVSQLRSLAAIGLERQADLTTPFEMSWAWIIEAAWIRSVLTEQQKSQYLRQAHAGFPHVLTASRFREGGTWRLQISCLELRMPGGSGMLSVGTGATGLFARVTIRDQAGSVVADMDLDLPPPGAFGKTIDLTPSLQPGVHTLTIDCAAGLRWFDPNGDGTYTRREVSPIAEWSASSQHTVEVVPPDGALVDVKPDESMRAAIIGALTIDMVAPLVTLSTGMVPGGGIVAIDRAPSAVAFDVFGRSGEIEHRIGSLVCGEGNTSFSRVHPHPAPLFPGVNSVDIILRTNASLAEKWLTITEIWDGEIVIPNVPVPPARPTPDLPLGAVMPAATQP